MSSTNKTTYYELPQFVDSDLFNPLKDDNDAYKKIDTALHDIAELEANDASEIVGVKGRVSTVEGKVAGLEAQNGDEALVTTAQTLSGAVNELDGDVSSLDGRLNVVEDDINNETTGLKVKVASLGTRITTAEGDIDALEAQNGNDTLITTAQTLSGGINELKNDENIFIDGASNITKFNNAENSETFVFWRYIPSTYSPKVGYVLDGVDYGVKIANEAGATCAINASRFTDQNEFLGYFRANGVTLHENDRTSDSPNYNILTFKDGLLNSAPVNTPTASLDDAGYEWALYGWEAIIVGGTPTERADPSDYETEDLHPRSFIAQLANNDYIIGSTDGRSGRSGGFTLSDITRFLQSLGYSIRFAYSLDGGGSVTLVEKGERVNTFINNENRKIKSIIYFKKDNGYYNDLLKSKTANIDADFRAREQTLAYNQGNIRSFGSYIENGAAGTTTMDLYDLLTRKHVTLYRTQKDRFFVGLDTDFSYTNNAYNILDISRDSNGIESFKFLDIARALFRENYSDSPATSNAFPPTAKTGVYQIYIADSSNAVAMGMTAEDYGWALLLRLHGKSNYDLILTRYNVFYRYDNGTLKQLT